MISTISHGSIIFGGKIVLIFQDSSYHEMIMKSGAVTLKYAQYSRQVFINSHSLEGKMTRNKNCCVLLPF